MCLLFSYNSFSAASQILRVRGDKVMFFRVSILLLLTIFWGVEGSFQEWRGEGEFFSTSILSRTGGADRYETDVAPLFWNHLQSSICKAAGGEKKDEYVCFTGLLFLYLGLLFLPFSSLRKHLVVAVSSLILFLLFTAHKNSW